MKHLLHLLIIIFVLLICLSCGEGSINTPTHDDETTLLLYKGNDSLIIALIDDAMQLCMEDQECLSQIDVIEPTSVISSSSSEDADTATIVESSSSRRYIVVERSSTSYRTESSSDESIEPIAENSSTSSTKFTVDDIETDGTCKLASVEIDKGSTVAAKFTYTTPSLPSGMSLLDFIGIVTEYESKFAEFDCEWKVKDKTTNQPCGNGAYSHTFDKPGKYDVSVTIKEKTFACGNVLVNGAPITGCKCKPDNYKPNVVDGAVDVLWTVTGCTTNGTITDYEWDGVTGSGETGSASFDTKAQTIKPSVTVTNDDGTVKTFACDSAKAIDTSKPDYEIVRGETLEVPVGECGVATVAGNIRFEHPHEWQTSSCTITLTINGTEYTKSVSNCNVYYGILPCDGISVTAGTQICVNEVSSIYGKLKMKYQ